MSQKSILLSCAISAILFSDNALTDYKATAQDKIYHAANELYEQTGSETAKRLLEKPLSDFSQQELNQVIIKLLEREESLQIERTFDIRGRDIEEINSFAHIRT